MARAPQNFFGRRLATASVRRIPASAPKESGLTSNQIGSLLATQRQVCSLIFHNDDRPSARGLLSGLQQAFPPSNLLFNVLLTGYTLLQDKHGIQKAFLLMKASKVEPDLHAYNTMLRYYRDAADLESLEHTFQKIKEPDLKSFTTMISAYAKAGNIGVVEELYARLRKCGIEPDLRVHNVLLSAYLAKGRAREACHVTKSMAEKGIVANFVTHKILFQAMVGRQQGPDLPGAMALFGEKLRGNGAMAAGDYHELFRTVGAAQAPLSDRVAASLEIFEACVYGTKKADPSMIHWLLRHLQLSRDAGLAAALWRAVQQTPEAISHRDTNRLVRLIRLQCPEILATQ